MFKIARALGISIGELVGEAGAGANPREEVELPPSLREFARQERLPEDDLKMLARIRYRGRVPRTVDDWRFIYESIRRSTEGR
jgi:hypothetical protein